MEKSEKHCTKIHLLIIIRIGIDNAHVYVHIIKFEISFFQCYFLFFPQISKFLSQNNYAILLKVIICINWSFTKMNFNI